jgi:hypothetical protein
MSAENMENVIFTHFTHSVCKMDVTTLGWNILKMTLKIMKYVYTVANCTKTAILSF